MIVRIKCVEITTQHDRRTGIIIHIPALSRAEEQQKTTKQ